MALEFTHNQNILTLGVEMEIQLLDSKALTLVPKSEEVIKTLNSPKLAKEMFRSTLEIITGVCDNVHEAGKDLTATLGLVEALKENNNLRFSGTGTNPVADYRERLLSTSPRYHELMDRNQWLIKRMAVYGLHVHVAMKNGDECMRFNNFFLQLIPHLIAISASSPFWQGNNTGLAACRPTVYESHPTAGMPQLFSNWQQFSERYDELQRTGSIQSMKDIWWDIRPSPTFGTLEIRICDGPATMAELLAIVAFIHTLAHWFTENEEFFLEQNPPMPELWLLRENKWRAIRYGLEAEFINHRTLRTFPMRNQIQKWMGMLKPYYDKLNYSEHYTTLENIVEKGNSSMRQIAAYNKRKELQDVLELNAAEFDLRKPMW